MDSCTQRFISRRIRAEATLTDQYFFPRSVEQALSAKNIEAATSPP